MRFETWVDIFPFWAIFGISIVLVLLSITLGIKLGSVLKAGSAADRTSPGAVIGATIGFLAFMLAFTFNMTSNRFDERKHLLVDEMSAIGTTDLRAGLLPEPYASHARALLLEYVAVRVHITKEPSMIMQDIARSDAIQDELWSDVEKMASEHKGNEYQKLYIQSLNDMLDLQDKRVASALYNRIPGAIWAGLFIITILSMVAVGYQFGQSSHHHVLINLMLAIAFSSVIVLIADLDRESEGLIHVNQQPLYDLQQRLDPSK